MAYKKRKRIGAIDTTTLLLLVGGAAVLYFVLKPQTPPAVVYKPIPQGSNTSGALTAAEITAGAGLVSTALNDLTDNSEG
jgi:hypothetical protein